MTKTFIKEDRCLEVYNNENGMYASCELKKYADPESMKVFMNGEQIFPFRYSLLGEPHFSMAVYDEYRKHVNALYRETGGNFANFTVQIEYQEKDFNFTRESFDTIEGISARLTDLKTLTEILEARTIYRQIVNMDTWLNEFVLFGTFLLGTLGGVEAFTETRADIPSAFRCSVVSRRQLDSILCKGYQSTVTRLPNSDSRCKVCGSGWTLEDLKCGNFEGFNYKYFKGEEYHKKCFGDDQTDK